MILLTLSRGKGEETVRLQLPASPAEIGETFAFLDRISLDTTATAILDVSSNVPVLYRCLYDVDVEDSEQFQKLQKLAERTEALSPAKAAIFSGALDAECVWNLEGALTVADRLDEYMLVNNVSSDSELGIYLVNKGITPFPDRFKPYINYARVGAEYREKHGGEYSSGNYVQKKTPELLENERLDGVFRIWMENPCPVRVQSETAQITLPATFEQLESARQLLGVDSLNMAKLTRVEALRPYLGEYLPLQGMDLRLEQLDELAENIRILSRLNAFLDSEMEQILCFDTAIDAEKFCNEKSAIFIVLPEEDQTKYFMVSLILQNLYREILTVADENGGRLKNRVVFFADELGTCPPIQSLELMFSASRSRGLMLVPIVQSITGQLQKNYGKEGSEIIVDNCQVNLYGGFAPASQTAVELSKSLGSRTVMSGSISRGKNDPSQSLQMMERPLMTPDELKSMPKGSFIVAKTGVHPMKVKLRLFLDWGIRFGMPYEVPEKAQRFVAYADKQELEESIIRRHYGTIVMDSEQPQGGGTSAGGMAQGIQAAPDSRKTVFRP